MASSKTDGGEYTLELTRERADIESITLAIVDAIAALEDVEPTKLDPLYYYIDPEALDALFRDATSKGSRRLTFTYREYEITVAGDAGSTISIAVR